MPPTVTGIHTATICISIPVIGTESTDSAILTTVVDTRSRVHHTFATIGDNPTAVIDIPTTVIDTFAAVSKVVVISLAFTDTFAAAINKFTAVNTFGHTPSSVIRIPFAVTHSATAFGNL